MNQWKTLPRTNIFSEFLQNKKKIHENHYKMTYGLTRTQSLVSLSPTSAGGYVRPRMLLTRNYSVVDMTAGFRESDK